MGACPISVPEQLLHEGKNCSLEEQDLHIQADFMVIPYVMHGSVSTTTTENAPIMGSITTIFWECSMMELA